MPQSGQRSAAPEGFDRWLEAAREGSDSDLARCLEACRSYLLVCAGQALPADLRPKCAPSDLVQESIIEARADFAGFRGTTHEELLKWLRSILDHNAADAIRKFRASAKRQIGRELPLDAHGPSDRQRAACLDRGPSPSSALGHVEAQQQVVRAIARLREDYRQVVELRNIQGLNYGEIAARMGRSAEAVRKLWTRAMKDLAEDLGPDHGDK